MKDFLFHATRLAPSPTGALHLGHARSFLMAWWMARAVGAKVLMRMDDLDLSRAKPESVEQAYADLRWLGMEWDEGEAVQSQRRELYADALRVLAERELIYPCTCSRADIAAAVAGSASAPHAGEWQIRYPGTCAGRTAKDIPGIPYCWRLRVPASAIRFTDLVAGDQAIDVEGDSGDFPLTRFDGTPAYQLACVVDDHAMGVDLVLRGDDLLSSTPRQILLYQGLGWQLPRFAHVPLVVGLDGKRLAKRHGESRIAQCRERGIAAERVVGWIAWRSGQIDTMREMAARELVGRFELEKVPKGAVVMTGEDLVILGLGK